MKNKQSSRIATVLVNIFNVRKWSDYDRVKSFTTYLGEGFKKIFIPQKNTGGQSFDEAMKTYNVTEKDLIRQQKALWRLSVLMLVVASLIFAYAIYHLVYGTFVAVLLSLVVMAIALSLAFRYHFWYYQIKVRKLGCTFKEWYRYGLMGEKQ